MNDTSLPQAQDGVNIEIPEPAERRWVVLVFYTEHRHDPETDEDYRILTPLWVLSPKGGGPASLLDEKTWSDRSMAAQRRNMTRDKLRKDRGSSGRSAGVGFVHEGELYWPDGVSAMDTREVR